MANTNQASTDQDKNQLPVTEVTSENPQQTDEPLDKEVREEVVVTEGTTLNVLDDLDGRLPVERYEQQIMKAVRDNDVTIITAGTGAGKSTLIGQFLNKSGYKAIITQPRRVAASTLARRVAQQMKVPLGGKVGYRTATEKRDSRETDIFFCTDGLQMVRELMEYKEAGYEKVLVIDEIHEWNINMEVLAAWVKQRLSRGDKLKVVIMSATMEAGEIAKFFGTKTAHIDVPGRLYPIEEFRKPASEFIPSIVELAEQGRNILAFQPGKGEIQTTIQQLQSRVGDKAVIFPLHGELSDQQQRDCFKPAPPGKVKIVVSTNVAQTSITIPDIDAVVDRGQEKQMGVNAGVKHLRLVATSKKDCEQRKGRAGRTKPGIYVLCSDLEYNERPDHSTPEILREELDDMVLHLARHDFDASELKFFHQPDVAGINKAKEFLIEIGALNEKGKITPIGKRMDMIPLVPRYARMVVEAQKHDVVKEVATIAAILGSGDIRRKSDSSSPPWRDLTKETQSDLLAVLDLFEAAQRMVGKREGSAQQTLEAAGFLPGNFFRTQNVRRDILGTVRESFQNDGQTRSQNQRDRRAILKSCLAGLLDKVYRKNGDTYSQSSSEEGNFLARESICRLGKEVLPPLVIGLPIKVPGKTRKGKAITVPLLTMATEVDLPLLREIAPHLITTQETGALYYDRKEDGICIKEEVFFKGKKITELSKPKPDQAEAADIFARWLASQYDDENEGLKKVFAHNREVMEAARRWNRRNGQPVFEIMDSTEAKTAYFRSKLGNTASIGGIKNFEDLLFPKPDQELVDLILADNPDHIAVLEQQIPVEYESDKPRAIFKEKAISPATLMQLPDSDIVLPGGRKVELVLQGIWRGDIVRDSDPKTFKKKIHEYYNQEVWRNWKDRPELTLPDLSDDHCTIPKIVMVEVGKSAINDEILKAYGTVAVKTYSSENPFESQWFMDEGVAGEAREGACRKLEEIKEERKVGQEKEKSLETAHALQEEISGHKSNYDLEYDLRRKLDSYAYASLRSKSVAELREWMNEATTALNPVRTALAKIQAEREKQELERKLEETKEAEKLEKYGVQGELYETAKQLADCAIGLRGVKGAQLLLDHQLKAPYGRERRQNAINDILGDPNGFLSSFYYLHRAADVDAVLAAALKMVDERQSPPPKKGGSAEKSVTTRSEEQVQPLTGKIDISGLQAKWGKGGKKR